MLFKRGRNYLYLISLLCGAAVIYGAITFGVEVRDLLASLFQIILLMTIVIGLAAVSVYLLSLARKFRTKNPPENNPDEVSPELNQGGQEPSKGLSEE
ncbi:MAG: hypothetical protein K6L73_04175 [Cellvibrionaceae bacterium]